MPSENVALAAYRHTRSSTRRDKNKDPAETAPVAGPDASLPSTPSSTPSPPTIPATLSRPSPIALDGVYTLILERTCSIEGHCMMDLTVPLQVSVGYECHWPLLLLADDRPAAVAEEGYLYQGNYSACFAIRHLSRAANKLDCNIRNALYLREGAPFSLTLPDINNSTITSMMVMKSLVNQLVKDKCDGTRPVNESPSRASLLGLGIYRLRVDHDPADTMLHSNYVARVHIHPRPASSTEESRIVHFPVKPSIPAKKVVQMVQNLVDTTNPRPRRARLDTIRLFYDDAEIPYDKGILLGETMFRVAEERRMCIDLEATWAE